jgi:hypothetical protein
VCGHVRRGAGVRGPLPGVALQQQISECTDQRCLLEVVVVAHRGGGGGMFRPKACLGAGGPETGLLRELGWLSVVEGDD